jgi:hypothetical protein
MAEFAKRVPIYCKGCGYALSGLTSRACPECGKPFKPSDPATVRAVPTGSRTALGEAPATAFIITVVCSMILWPCCGCGGFYGAAFNDVGFTDRGIVLFAVWMYAYAAYPAMVLAAGLAILMFAHRMTTRAITVVALLPLAYWAATIVLLLLSFRR